MLPQIGGGGAQRCCLCRLYTSLLNEIVVFGFQLHNVAAQGDIVGSQPLNLADQIVDHEVLQRDLLLEQLRVLGIWIHSGGSRRSPLRAMAESYAAIDTRQYVIGVGPRMAVLALLIVAGLSVDEFEAVSLETMACIGVLGRLLVAPRDGLDGRLFVIEADEGALGIRALDDAHRRETIKASEVRGGGELVLRVCIAVQNRHITAVAVQDLHRSQSLERQGAVVDHTASTESRCDV